MMKNHSGNPWAARFEPLLDKGVIRARARLSPTPITGLAEMPIELACASLEKVLNAVFYPTDQCVDVLARLAGTAYAHCVTHYGDTKKFLSRLYGDDPWLPEFAFPILLTGLAGTGKTELLKALARIQMDEEYICIDETHSPFPVKKSWTFKVNARSSPSEILKAIANTDGGMAALTAACRANGYREGRPFLAVDEFQFATGSDKANTRVTQILLSICQIGLPWLYAANFSLVSRILRRPEEDGQRLISDYIVLRPDDPAGADWQQTLTAQREVAPDVLKFDPVNDAALLHRYTGGRKRAVVKLLVHALRFEHPRGAVVDMAAITRAYHSDKYARYREESDILANQAVLNRPDKERKDLWCPLPLPQAKTNALADAAKEFRSEQVADSMMRSSLNGDERRSLQEIERQTGAAHKPNGKVIPMRKRKALTAEELKKNSNWFKDQL